MPPTVRASFEVTGTKEVIKNLRAKGIEITGLMGPAAEAGAEVIQRAANRDAPGPHIVHSRPRLAGKNKVEIRVGPDRDHFHYLFIETGAGPHPIPKRGSAILQFPSDGEEVFTQAVQHPGLNPRPFLRPALDENKVPTVNAVQNVFRRAL